MSRKKRVVSKVILGAVARSAGIESIDPLPDMGTEITVAGYKTLIASGQNKLVAYNTLLTEADEAKNLLEEEERRISDYSDRILAAVAAKFGRNSNEYEMAGGTKKSERRRRKGTTPASVGPLNQAA